MILNIFTVSHFVCLRYFLDNRHIKQHLPSAIRLRLSNHFTLNLDKRFYSYVMRTSFANTVNLIRRLAMDNSSMDCVEIASKSSPNEINTAAAKQDSEHLNVTQMDLTSTETECKRGKIGSKVSFLLQSTLFLYFSQHFILVNFSHVN